MPVDDEGLFSVFTSATAMMAAYFDLVASVARWMEEEGVESRDAALFVSSMVQALSSLTTRADAQKLQQMSEACMTVGGLNEQVLTACRAENFNDILREQLDLVMMRLSQSN